LDDIPPKSKNPSPRGSGSADLGAPQEFGPECGGKGGVPYLSMFHPPARLVKITVLHRDYVDGIQLETDSSVLPRIGGTGKHRDVQRDVIDLGKDEVLTGITVLYWQYVDQITFHTNLRSYGPYGGPGGRVSRTLLSPSGRKVVGFKGRHWALIDSIQLMIA
jgi:hypothetical protein